MSLTKREKERGIDPDAPKGISFYSVKGDETRFAKSSAQIQAYINSSNMGINASRGQDKGWRLSADWVKRVRAFQADEDRMDRLSAKLRLEDGVTPNTIQILHYLYGRQIRAYAQKLKNNENPFEEKYLQEISSNSDEPVVSEPGEPTDPKPTKKKKTNSQDSGTGQ